jgi:hypothetical protein
VETVTCVSYEEYVTRIKSRTVRWVGYVAHMRERRGTYSVLVGKSDRNRPLGRPRQRWEDNIKMIIKLVRRS